eukprot:TRINITY_DN22906_c0_g1_i6.p1 TRINITY_DN22906_c0_g1~~TRINITY_DN22906_c0_g1_i6.p1  ORF type:complete len:193 (-),score=-13.06 TRINITY_DN22906_c0_g1_i6:426-1004(-)
MRVFFSIGDSIGQCIGYNKKQIFQLRYILQESQVQIYKNYLIDIIIAIYCCFWGTCELFNFNIFQTIVNNTNIIQLILLQLFIVGFGELGKTSQSYKSLSVWCFVIWRFIFFEIVINQVLGEIFLFRKKILFQFKFLFFQFQNRSQTFLNLAQASSKKFRILKYNVGILHLILNMLCKIVLKFCILLLDFRF